MATHLYIIIRCSGSLKNINTERKKTLRDSRQVQTTQQIDFEFKWKF